jgi:hypothetical protein
MDKHLWTQHEDQLLRYLYETMKINKWSQIARKLTEDYDIKGRSGKQCR